MQQCVLAYRRPKSFSVLLIVCYSRNVSCLFSVLFLECFITFTTTTSKLFSGSLPTFSFIMFWVFTTFLCLQHSSLTSHFPTYCVNAHFFPDCCIISIAPHLHSKLLKLVEWLVWALQMDWLTTRFLSLQLSLPSLMVVLYLSVPFVGVYGISLTLGSLFAEDWLHFSVLLVVWCEASALGCVGIWVQCIWD